MGNTLSRFAAAAIVGVLACGWEARAQQVTSITNADIVTATTAAAAEIACLDFRINGVCLFLVCTPAGCTIETSIQFRHFNPALIVTSYDSLDQSPWAEIQASFGAAQAAANDALFAGIGISLLVPQGTGEFTDKQKETDLETESERANRTVFKNAEVIGSPGSTLSLAGTLGLPLFCPTTDVFPLFPYFLSGLDSFAWRSGLTEILFPETFTPGLREIGAFPFNTWGSVHPRAGYLNSPEEPKAAAVMAQRAADIATRELQPHVYVPVGSVPGLPADGLVVFEPDPVLENDPENSKWQFLMPVTETTCEAFGENDTGNVLDGWANGRFSSAGDYAWALWRPYRCCQEEGIFLTEIEFFQ